MDSYRGDYSLSYLSRANGWTISIWAESGIQFAFAHLYGPLQVSQKMSLEDSFQLMDALTAKNQLINEEKKIKQ